MRMSSGSSRRKLKPRPGASSCIDETPRSASTPSTPSDATRIQHRAEVAKVGVHQLDACAESHQPLAVPAPAPTRSRSSPMSLARAGLEQRLRVTTETDRAVDEDAATCGRELLEHLVDHDRCVHQSRTGRRPAVDRPQIPNSASRSPSSSVSGSRLQLLDEQLLVPHLEIIDVAEDANLADNGRRSSRSCGGMTMRPCTSSSLGLSVVVHGDRETGRARGDCSASPTACARSRARPASGRCGRSRP